MKPKLLILLVLSAAVLAIIGISLPFYSGTLGTSPNAYEYVFYLLGVYSRTNLSTGDVSNNFLPMWALMVSAAIFCTLAGVIYELVTLAPKIKAGKLNILGGILILTGAIYPLAMIWNIGWMQVYRPFSPGGNVGINTFATLQPLGLVLGIVAGTLAILSGILFILQNRKAPK